MSKVTSGVIVKEPKNNILVPCNLTNVFIDQPANYHPDFIDSCVKPFHFSIFNYKKPFISCNCLFRKVN